MSLPNIGADAFDGLGDPLVVGVIAKSVKDFETQEEFKRFKEVYGVQIPTQPRDLVLLPEGERNWRYLTFYSDDTTLRNDYFVETEELVAGRVRKVQYRIVGTEPWDSFNKYIFQECPRAGSAVAENESATAEANP